MYYMRLLAIYRCLCDETRLRILNLLAVKPLCVCYIQEILNQPQVKVSKHLAYLKAQGMAESRRHQNWMIYSLPKRRAQELDANLRCLQDCVSTEPVFKRDLGKLKKLKTDCAGLKMPSISDKSAACAC